VFEQFVAIAGVAITLLQANPVHIPIGNPQPRGLSLAQSSTKCQILSVTGGDLVGTSRTPSELLPNRLMTVKVICDRPSTVTVYIDNGQSRLQNGVAEVALLGRGSSGVYSGLPNTPSWGTSASFTAPATMNSGGDYFSVAARVRAASGKLLRSGGYRMRVKVRIQPGI
jgi:hypothetical protein